MGNQTKVILVSTTNQAKVAAEKEKLEIEFQEKQSKLAKLEQERMKAATEKKAKDQDNFSLKKDIQDVEIVLTKLEQEKSNKDHTISTLNDVITNQDETINKMNKEKKRLIESNTKSDEDLQTVEDKY